MNTINTNIYDNLELLPLDLQGWNSDSKIFDELIIDVKPNIIIEVGTWKGRSAIHMANVIKANNLNCRIYCVDTWLGALEFWTSHKDTPERNLLQKNGYPQIYYQFLSNVVHNKCQDIILPFPNTSTCAAKYFAKQNITPQLIYIDGSHEYEDVIRDLEMYYSLLSPGGMMFGDDYYNFNGVQKAVGEFRSNHNYWSFEIREHNFWLIQKENIKSLV